MNKNKTNLVLNALIILPMFSSMSGTTGAFLALEHGSPIAMVSSLVSNEEEVLSFEEAERLEKAAKIDAYFGKYNLPLEGYGMKFVLEAEKNGLDWRLLPAFAMAESTACKFIIDSTHNCFGWGGGKINFTSFDHGIEIVAWNLGGNNPNTARYYAGKTTSQIIDKYNPPSVVPSYNGKIHSIMAKIEATPVPVVPLATEATAVAEA